MQIVAITPEITTPQETVVVNRLFFEGLKRLHVRKPFSTIADLRHYIKNINPAYHSRMVLCGCFDLLNEGNFGGVHLNSFLRSDPATLEKISGIKPSLISASFHSWKELDNTGTDWGYVFISPVFDSISKNGYKAGIDLEGANALKKKKVLENKYCPGIIGLGGVGKEQAVVLHQNGFDGAAILGAIWMAPDPVAAFTQLKKMVNALAT